MKIILASQSPRRREILTLMEIPFEVIESHVQEVPPVGATPEELVKALAEQGVDRVQGFALARPMPLDKLTAFYRENPLG